MLKVFVFLPNKKSNTMKKIIALVIIISSFSVRAQTELPKSATEIAPLLIGEKIPSVSLKTVENKLVNLQDLFAKQKTIVLVYRGGWCPYCNAHLAAIGEVEEDLLALGYQIIAISPDAPENLKSTDEKQKLNYMLLSDSDGLFSKSVGIAFQAPENYKKTISKGSLGINKSFLPVPALFILNKNAEIEFEYLTPNFKTRISTELLIAVAQALQSKS